MSGLGIGILLFTACTIIGMFENKLNRIENKLDRLLRATE